MGWVRCCVYSADGAMLLSGGDDNTLKLWSVATGACIRTFNGHTHWIMSCCFSPADGNTILSGSCDKTLKLWEATTGVCRRTLTGHTGVVRGCAFSPVYGNLVLFCSNDSTLKLWDATTGCARRRWRGTRVASTAAHSAPTEQPSPAATIWASSSSGDDGDASRE